MEFTDVKVIGADREHIAKDPTLANAFKCPFILSVKPDDLWVKFLHHSYRMSSFSKKRQYSVVDNQVILTIFHDDHIQAQLDFLKELVIAANEEYQRLLQRKIEEKLEEEARKKREQETIQRLREEIDKIRF